MLRSPAERKQLLDDRGLIAIVGASSNPLRPSYFVFRYLLTHGFAAYPVNPAYRDVDGVRCFPTLAAFAAELRPPDVVDVFRKAADAPQVTREAIQAGAKAIWFQYGVINQEAIQTADAAGLAVVVDRCMKVEHARFAGGLTVTGMNSGVISAKRRLMGAR
ncbi:MAG: CoA-binding protein [Candidatus Eremiobacteraeota bacterium]|nr:CoA-binding protein [Candidatus Eremiobacteraeota bacterium]MBC5826706.1 CoA-binding protein [Candidatus Eremiobacteraeota bacterium]